MKKTLYFNNPTQGRVSFEEAVSSIVSFIQEEPDSSYRLIIGTDSREHWRGSSTQVFVTALIIHRVGFKDELSDYKIEIHIDVGSNGPTRHLIRELVGMIESFGFIACVKPESFGASRVAHRHT